ncbi:sporulation sigma factor SigK [Paenibacillus sp. FSL R7-269]|nr:sporulation sigma factor SigK [Paenibacillus sp. FSL R7-269]
MVRCGLLQHISYVSRIEKRALMKLYHEFYKVKR